MEQDAQAAPASKLQEQAIGKADLSYSWWTNHAAAQSGSSQPAAPRKLTEEEVAHMERKGSAQGASAWNHAGTFEEKSVGEWARQWIKTNLCGLCQGRIQVAEVTSVEGDANIWFVRGKPRHGFDFSIQLQIKAEGTDITATLKIPNACLDDIDELFTDVEVTNKRPEKATLEAEVAKEAAGLAPLITARLKDFYAELKQKQ